MEARAAVDAAWCHQGRALEVGVHQAAGAAGHGRGAPVRRATAERKAEEIAAELEKVRASEEALRGTL